jgi:trigger factor
MKFEKKDVGSSKIELTITVEPPDYKNNMEAAAKRLSERAAIQGFRPGKAPYDIVKQQLGEVKILEEAMQSIVEHNFYEVVKQEKLETIGMPQITLQKFAPGNELVFKAEIALLPKVVLPELTTIKVDAKKISVTKEQTDEMLENIRKMQRKETIKNSAATKEDKVVIDLDMFIDKVPVDGGQAKNHQIYLSEPHYIPGLAEQIVGLKKDDTKEFNLPFPKEHYQKHLAGKKVDFKIKVNEVFELQYPELNDEFAKILGQESLQKLVELLTINITKEEEQKEEQRIEIALLDQLIEKSTFTDIPDVLIDAEKNKMFYELKHSLDERGISVEQYLQDLKKTQEEIFKDFSEQATKRAKAALISRQIALDNTIKVEDKELKEEIELIKATYPDNERVTENLARPEVIDTIASTIQNRKVMKWLKEKILSQNK